MTSKKFKDLIRNFNLRIDSASKEIFFSFLEIGSPTDPRRERVPVAEPSQNSRKAPPLFEKSQPKQIFCLK